MTEFTAIAPLIAEPHGSESPPGAESSAPAEQPIPGSRARKFRHVEPTPARSWSDVEQLVGQKWASMVGALVFVIGMGLLFTVAWRRGWFHIVPPGVKCVMGGVVGLGMLVGAEFVRKKLNAMAAIGLNAAGLGVVYLSAYAAFAMYQLIPPGTAFGLLAGVALLGIAISARSGHASVGVLALVGGYITPFLVHSDHPSPWVMPIHLTVLLGLAAGLTGWRGPTFAAVRTTGLLGTLVIGGIWALASDSLPLTPVLFFAGAAWALIIGETCRAVTVWALEMRLAQTSANAAMLGSVSATGWSLAVGVLTLQNSRPGGVAESLDWTVPLGLAIASAGVAWRLAPNARALLGKPGSLAQSFACILTWEALALVPTAIALGCANWLTIAAWSFMALAAALAAKRTGLWTLSVYAVVLLLATTIRLVLIDSWNDETLAIGKLVQGIYFGRWMAMAAVLAGAWLAVARLTGFNTDAATPIAPPWRRTLGRIAAITGAALVLGLWFHSKTEMRSLTFVLPMVASGLLVVRRIWPGLWVDRTATVGIMLTAGLWLCYSVSEGWLSNDAPIFLHPGLMSSFLVAGAALMAGWLTDNPCGSVYRRSVFLAAGWTLAGATLFVSTSFEIARVGKIVIADTTARAAAVSVWWTLLAIALIVGGFVIRMPWPRREGLGLLGLALAKVVIYDLAAVSLEWRAVSFLVLGAVMLAVGLVYSKVAAKLHGQGDVVKAED